MGDIAAKGLAKKKLAERQIYVTTESSQTFFKKYEINIATVFLNVNILQRNISFCKACKSQKHVQLL